MKESFLLYKSFYEPIKGLSLEEKGILLDAIFQYQIDGTEPTNKSIIMPFMFFKNQFRLDGIKYNKIVDRNRINGSKGGRPKKPSGLIDNPKNPSKPKKADKDNDNDNENEKLIPKTKKVFSKDIFDCYYDCLIYFPNHLHPEDNNIWLDVIEKLNRIDNIPFERIVQITSWARNNEFWKSNFLSLTKLRKKDKQNIKYIVVFNEKMTSNGQSSKQQVSEIAGAIQRKYSN